MGPQTLSTRQRIDVEVEHHGSIVLLRPRNKTARTWIDENVQDGAMFYGNALVVEPRYVLDLIDGMQADGLRVEA